VLLLADGLEDMTNLAPAIPVDRRLSPDRGPRLAHMLASNRLTACVVRADAVDAPPFATHPLMFVEFDLARLDRAARRGVPANPYTRRHARFTGRVLLVGLGSRAQCLIPLLLRHVDGLDPTRITVVAADDRGAASARAHGVRLVVQPLRREGLEAALAELAREGDLVVHAAGEVGTDDLAACCSRRGLLFVDGGAATWPAEGVTREAVWDDEPPSPAAATVTCDGGEPRPTALRGHGVVPGLLFSVLKQGLEQLQEAEGAEAASLTGDWAACAERLGITTIHLVEHDGQIVRLATPRGPNELVASSGALRLFRRSTRCRTSLAFGTDESQELAADSVSQTERDPSGRITAARLDFAAPAIPIRSWSPTIGPFRGFLTPSDVFGIADACTRYDDDGIVQFRPSVMHVHRPCDDAVAFLEQVEMRPFRAADEPSLSTRTLGGAEVVDGGASAVGVLLGGPNRKAVWLGSVLSSEEARTLLPCSSAGALQEAAALLAGVMWVLVNPRRGSVGPFDVDHTQALEIALPYLGGGGLVCRTTDWAPANRRPWQFHSTDI